MCGLLRLGTLCYTHSGVMRPRGKQYESTPVRDTIIAQSLAERALEIARSDGYHGTFHYIWLRDNCHCLECRHTNGQRIIETSLTPSDIPNFSYFGRRRRVNAWARQRLKWANEGHRSRFLPTLLRSNCYQTGDRLRRKLRNAERPIRTRPGFVQI